MTARRRRAAAAARSPRLARCAAWRCLPSSRQTRHRSRSTAAAWASSRHEPACQPARCLPPKPGLKRHQPAPGLCPLPAPACLSLPQNLTSASPRLPPSLLLLACSPPYSPAGSLCPRQVASACESVQLAIGDHKMRRVAEDAARAKQLLTAQLERSTASVRSAAETQVGSKHLEARVAEYRRLSETLSALEVAGQEAASVRQHEERQMRATAEKLRLQTKELKRK